MKPVALLLLAAASVCAAENYSWTNVRELAGGAEIRVFRSKTREPLLAKFDRASEENLIVITKSGQESIAKADIDRIERRTGEPSRWKTLAGRKVERKGAELSGNAIPGGTTTVKTGVDLSAKPGFEKIYDRTAEEE